MFQNFSKSIALALFLLVGGTFALFWIAARLASPEDRQHAYIAGMLLTVVSFALIGRGSCRGYLGLLIDDYNRLSLSRLQAMIWTIVILPGFAVAVAWNTQAQPVGQGMNVDIPEQVYLLLGISATTLVAAQAIKQDKGNQAGIGNANVGLQTGSQNWSAVSNLAVHAAPESASLTDLFLSDASAPNQIEPSLDFNRLQQLYISIIVSIGYAMMLYGLFGAPGRIDKLPDLSAGALALVAVSHGSYLAGKASVKATDPS